MKRLFFVKYTLREVLFGWNQIGDKFGEDDAILLPKLFYEANQPERVSERAEGGGRRTLLLQVTPVNLHAHVVVAPGIFGMQRPYSPVHVPSYQLAARG